MTVTTTEDLVRHINAQFAQITAQNDKAGESLQGISGRLLALEQRSQANENGNGGNRPKSWGGRFVASNGYKNFVGDMGHRGTVRIPIEASITIASGEFDSLAPPDRQREIVGLGRIRPTIRSLLAPGRTGSDLVQFPRMVERTNNAAPVAPGETKPQSDYEFEIAEAKVRTIAHWVPITRQMADDTPGLMTLIDGELRYGLQRAEEDQILYGDGTGENIFGLIPQATPYSPPFEVQQKTMLDELLLAIAQSQESQIPATGVVVNDLDWKMMQSLKDGEGRYLGAGPFGAQANLAWTLPVIDTPALEPGEFLVGGFGLAAQLLDRMDVEVLISSEDRDNFIKNMLTVRAEERVALAVKRPQAIVYGTFETPSG